MSSAIISASKRLAIIASPRATAIMKGLLKSGRVEPGVVIGNFVKLPHTGHRESYFVRADGQLLHGVSLAACRGDRGAVSAYRQGSARLMSSLRLNLNPYLCQDVACMRADAMFLSSARRIPPRRAAFSE
jgi:hypothetical protein